METRMIGIGLIVVVFVVAALFLAIGSGFGGGFNCGEDVDCYLEKAENCELATLKVSGEGSGVSYTRTIAIKGGTPEECEVYMKIDKVNVEGDFGPAEQEMIDELIELMEGKDATCTVRTSTITKSVPEGIASNMDECHGSLVDAVKEAGNMF